MKYTRNVDVTDNENYTPLMRALNSSFPKKVAPLLMQNGANLNIRNDFGKSARDIAKSRQFDKRLV